MKWLLLFLASALTCEAQLTVPTWNNTNLHVTTLFISPPPAPLSCDSINDSFLKGWWKLDEPSGDATDSKGSNTLTDNNGVTTEVGKIGTSRYFTAASNKHLSIADNADLSGGGTVGAFVYFGGTLNPLSYPGIISKWTALAGQREITLYLNGDNQRYEFAVSLDGTASTIVTADNFGDPQNQAWHCVIGWVDVSGGTINIQVDNGAVDSEPFAGPVFDGTANFTIGSGADDGSAGWTGTVDEAFFSARVLTAIERQALYNLALACRPADLNP